MTKLLVEIGNETLPVHELVDTDPPERRAYVMTYQGGPVFCVRYSDVTLAPDVDPRLQRRRDILDSFDSDPLTAVQAHELYKELAELEASLQYRPADEPEDNIPF